jgi:S-layer homology domain
VRIGKRRLSKRLVFILVAVVLVLGVGGVGVAYAADALPFTDISGNWAEQAIVNLAARGIVTGHADGTFGPNENVTRAQMATFLDRLNTEAMKPVAARRGCPDCHAGPYTLKAEAVGKAPAVHAGLADDAGVPVCLLCHAPGSGAQAGKGVAAPISLRDIVHPVHMGSKIFTGEFMGNCFSCHNVSGEGKFQVLTQAVDTNDAGIPNTLPIPGAVDPTRQ